MALTFAVIIEGRSAASVAAPVRIGATDAEALSTWCLLRALRTDGDPTRFAITQDTGLAPGASMIVESRKGGE